MKLSESNKCILLCVGVYLAFFVASFFVCKAVHIVDWNKWYAPDPYYYQQVDALLRGTFAISHSPGFLRIDLAWYNGAVQQIWGLAIPMLYAPLLLFSRLFIGQLYLPRKGCVSGCAFVSRILRLFGFQRFFSIFRK